MRLRSLLAGLAAACCCAAVQAAGEHERRLAAELVVMAGDTSRLTAGAGGPLERQGLEQRVAGALASLPMLLRRAQGNSAPVAALRAAHSQRDWRRLASQIETLVHRHRFDARPLLDAGPTPQALALGAAIHTATCAGCHDNPSGADTLLPAKNLAAQLKSMPRAEFAARLWLGVRGDRTTGLRNPFSDAELAALMALYSTAQGAR